MPWYLVREDMEVTLTISPAFISICQWQKRKRAIKTTRSIGRRRNDFSVNLRAPYAFSNTILKPAPVEAAQDETGFQQTAETPAPSQSTATVGPEMQSGVGTV
jgi:hypothetical protein